MLSNLYSIVGYWGYDLSYSVSLFQKTVVDKMLIVFSSYAGKREVNQQDLEEAAEEEIGKESTRTSFRRQDSDAARMYN